MKVTIVNGHFTINRKKTRALVERAVKKEMAMESSLPACRGVDRVVHS